MSTIGMSTPVHRTTDEIIDGTDFGAAARRAVARRIKMQARLYARRPMLLETLHPGLACASAARLVAIAEHLVARERASPRRWFGFGGEVNLVNAQAALLLGRALRRKEDPSPPHDISEGGAP